MQYIESNLIVNGIWKPCLTLVSAEPIIPPKNGVIVRTEEHFTTSYYTDGIHKQATENGLHYATFLVNGKSVESTLKPEVDRLAEENKVLQDQLASTQEAIDFLIMGGN